VCIHCGAVQSPDAAADHFRVLGIGRRYAIDLAGAEAAFKERSRQVHPDRFAKADPRARRASLAQTVQLNEAWRTLKDPVRRAEYLLTLAGHRIAAEAPPALLMEMLELREGLGEAREAGDGERVRSMAAAMRARADAALARAGAALAAGESEAVRVAAAADAAAAAEAETARGAAQEEAARELVALRYFRRFLDEVAAHEEAAAEAEQVAAAALPGEEAARRA
jgi:molecular chaperone HscB